MIIDTYYHGSERSNITRLKIDRQKSNPFGPAVYLTKDPLVADCYCRHGGAIYEVKLSGNMQFTINLDKSYSEQTIEAKEAILKSLKFLSQNTDSCHSINARDFIHPYGCSLFDVNDALVKNDIWLLYGHLSGMEISGLMDRGIQFAVMNESSLKITRETNYLEILKSD